MDIANRLAAVAAYITCGVIVGFCAYAGYHQYRESAATQTEPQPAPQSTFDIPVASRPPSDDVVGPRASQLYAQREQIERLQRLLNQKTELLDRKTELLNKTTEEQLRLQRGLETAIDLILMIASNAQSPDGMPVDSSQIRLAVEDFDRLKQQWAQSRSRSGQQQQELDQLGQELLLTDTVIAQVRQETDLEISALMARNEALKMAIADLVARFGDSAIPELIEALSDERPDVRAWAATALGRMGPDAQDAAPTLGELLSDPDPEVRAAAESALNTIVPMDR